MKLSRIEIQAFGCLSDFAEEIAPGLHIFHGPNESGKSTLQQAILALLYGFYEGDRAKSVENAARQRFIPWKHPRYTARLEYELRDGHGYRVTRDFADDDNPTTVSDIVTGRPVTDEFGRGRHGNVPFMRKQLGMTRRVFESCAFVSQGELLQITGEGRVTPQEMGDAIISLADTARRDVSAQKAIERLSDVLRNRSVDRLRGRLRSRLPGTALSLRNENSKRSTASAKRSPPTPKTSNGRKSRRVPSKSPSPATATCSA